MRHLTRRQAFLGALALAAPVPLRLAAQPARFVAALKRARGLEQLHALVISQAGEVVAGAALRGPPLETPVNVKSVSKSVVAALTGISIARGELPGVGATLGEIAPDLIPADADPQVGGITIEDLLTMRAGLERTSGPNYGGWVASGNWVADALSRPVLTEPGRRFAYSTGSFHVLGAVLAHISGLSLLEQARRRLGDPLGIAIPPWTRDPQGRFMGGNNMALSPRGMVRFGEAYRLRDPVPPDWVAASWRARTRSPFSGDSYGYGWFLTDTGGHFTAYARGYGGQMIYVVPDIELTVAITSDPTRPARSNGHVGALNRLLSETIVPAAESA